MQNRTTRLITFFILFGVLAIGIVAFGVSLTDKQSPMPNLPAYPGSAKVTQTNEGGETYDHWIARVPVGKVIKYYQQQLPVYGWQANNDVTLNGQDPVASYQHDDWSLTLQLHNLGNEGTDIEAYRRLLGH